MRGGIANMDYYSAVQEVISKYGESLLSDSSQSWLFYSLISDKIGKDPTGNRFKKIYFELNKEMNIYSIIKDKGLIESRRYFEKRFFDKYHSSYQGNEYVSVINGIIYVIYPSEYHKNSVNKNVTAEKVKVNSNKVTNNSPIKELKLDITCSSVHIYQVNDKEVSISVEGGPKIPLSMIGDKYLIKRQDKNINVFIPIKYKAWNITSQAFVLVIGDAHIKNKLESLRVNSSGFTYFYMNCNTADINVIDGGVKYFGSAHSLNINSKRGYIDIYFTTDTCKYKSSSISAHTGKGKISMEVSGGSYRPPIYSFIRPSKVKKSFYVTGYSKLKLKHLKLDLSTGRGGIHLKQ